MSSTTATAQTTSHVTSHTEGDESHSEDEEGTATVRASRIEELFEWYVAGPTRDSSLAAALEKIITKTLLYPSDIVEWDVNLTFACDLLDVNARLLRDLGRDSEVHPTADVHPGATIGPGTVIGPGARVAHPIRLEQCVLFAGATAFSEQDLFRCLITPHDTVLCHQR